MCAAKKAKSIIRRGPSGDRGSKDFITLKDGDTVTIVPILATSEIMSIDLHAFWEINPAVTFACLSGTDEDCPGCDLGDEPGYRAFLPVLDGDGEMKVFPFGIGVERKLTALEDEIGDITGLRLRVKRTGSGLKTKYEVINTGKREEVEVEDDDATTFVESKIEVKDHDKIVEELTEAGLMNGSSKKSKKAVEEEEEEDEAPRSKKPVAKGKAASVKAAVKGKAGKKPKDDEEWEE